MGKRLVVIGGDAAGGSAASQARKRQRDLDVVMFERGRATSYSACGIPYWISGAVEDEASLIARTPAQHRAAGIDVRIRTEVVGIDLDRRAVRWRDLDSGAEGTDPFDDLVYATGSVPMRPPVPGIDAAGVYGVQVLDDGAALRAELDRESVRRVVVIGGGYVGLQIARACRVRRRGWGAAGCRRAGARGPPAPPPGPPLPPPTWARRSPRRSGGRGSTWS